jgi:hypothetical protein
VIYGRSKAWQPALLLETRNDCQEWKDYNAGIISRGKPDEIKKTNGRSILIDLAVPILLVTILYTILPALEVPRLGLNRLYIKTLDIHIYYLLALIPVILYNRLKK